MLGLGNSFQGTSVLHSLGLGIVKPHLTGDQELNNIFLTFLIYLSWCLSSTISVYWRHQIRIRIKRMHYTLYSEAKVSENSYRRRTQSVVVVCSLYLFMLYTIYPSTLQQHPFIPRPPSVSMVYSWRHFERFFLTKYSAFRMQSANHRHRKFAVHI